jgi:hypothetical protein
MRCDSNGPSWSSLGGQIQGPTGRPRRTHSRLGFGQQWPALPSLPRRLRMCCLRVATISDTKKLWRHLYKKWHNYCIYTLLCAAAVSYSLLLAVARPNVTGMATLNAPASPRDGRFHVASGTCPVSRSSRHLLTVSC